MIESAKWTKVTSGGPALYPCMHFVKLFCDGAWWPFTRPRTRVHVILPNCVTSDGGVSLCFCVHARRAKTRM